MLPNAAYRPGGPIVLAAYDPRWSDVFAAVAHELRATLGDVVVDVQHVGSTAIPGIVAKPVIDVLLLVSSLNAIDAASPNVEALGYYARGEFGIPARRYFSRTSPDGVRLHQIHAFVAENAIASDMVSFRDYLRTNAPVAHEYELLKRDLAARFDDDVEGYAGAKAEFVADVLRRAAGSEQSGEMRA